MIVVLVGPNQAFSTAISINTSLYRENQLLILFILFTIYKIDFFTVFSFILGRSQKAYGFTGLSDLENPAASCVSIVGQRPCFLAGTYRGISYVLKNTVFPLSIANLSSLSDPFESPIIL